MFCQKSFPTALIQRWERSSKGAERVLELRFQNQLMFLCLSNSYCDCWRKAHWQKAPWQNAPRRKAPRQKAPRRKAPRRKAPRWKAPRSKAPRRKAHSKTVECGEKLTGIFEACGERLPYECESQSAMNAMPSTRTTQWIARLTQCFLYKVRIGRLETLN